MNNKYKVGDRVVCVAPSIPVGYGNGSKGIIAGLSEGGNYYYVQWDGAEDKRVVYECEIQLIKEKTMEKTYTVTLTELEAKVLCSLGGNTSSADGTIGKALSSTYIQLNIQGVPCLEMEGVKIYDFGWYRHGFEPVPITIPLNSSYKAEVSKDGVRVDGTLYSWDVVQALKDAVGKVATVGDWYDLGVLGSVVDAINEKRPLQVKISEDRDWQNMTGLPLIRYNLNWSYRTRTAIDSVSVPVGSYTAVVTKDRIKVGCQTFPTSIVDTLLANKPQ